MRNSPLKAFASSLKQTKPPKVTYRGDWKEKIGIKQPSLKKVKTYTPPSSSDNPNPPTYHYDKKGRVKKIVGEDRVTRIKRKHRK